MENLASAETHRQIPSRRSLRRQETGLVSSPEGDSRCSSVPTRQRSSANSLHKSVFVTASRGLILGALALFTVALPVSGALSTDLPVANAASSSSSWSILSSHVEVDESANLRTTPLAASRAAVREQVQIDRCLKTNSSANGLRTAMTKDEEKSRLLWPLPYGQYRFTSPFGMRVNPVLGIYRLHAGVDLAGASGTPVTSAANGQVLAVGTTSGLGYRVEIYHPDYQVTSVYGHMITGSSPLKVGQKVSAGDMIGRLGSTGNSTGPHLHFEIHQGKGATEANVTNPMPWMRSHLAGHTNVNDCQK